VCKLPVQGALQFSILNGLSLSSTACQPQRLFTFGTKRARSAGVANKPNRKAKAKDPRAKREEYGAAKPAKSSNRWYPSPEQQRKRREQEEAERAAQADRQRSDGYVYDPNEVEELERKYEKLGSMSTDEQLSQLRKSARDGDREAQVSRVMRKRQLNLFADPSTVLRCDCCSSSLN